MSAPTDRAELLRLMAKAHAKQELGKFDSQGAWLAYMDDVAAILRAIEAAGCVVAPRDPTEAQWHAGEKPVTTRSIYTAMLAAGPFGEGRMEQARCPECRLNWMMFPPVKIDGEPRVRCVECKRTFLDTGGAALAAAQAEIARLLDIIRHYNPDDALFDHEKPPMPDDLNKATWTTEEIGWILSARDQLARGIGCERSGTLCQASSFTEPCSCLERAIARVAEDPERWDDVDHVLTGETPDAG